MSSRVLKQQLSALTRQKGEKKELALQQKPLKSRKKRTAAKAKLGSLGSAEDDPAKSIPQSKEERKKNLQRNLEYLAAAEASPYAQSAQEKMQQVTSRRIVTVDAPPTSQAICQ